MLIGSFAPESNVSRDVNLPKIEIVHCVFKITIHFLHICTKDKGLNPKCTISKRRSNHITQKSDIGMECCSHNSLPTHT